MTTEVAPIVCKAAFGLCGAPASKVEAGCVHEHVGLVSLCPWHVERTRAGKATCAKCSRIDGHRCRVWIIDPKEPS